ncbi:MAG TPA: PspC domain-containing protein [Candidatus Marinimicrobia bacterium]|nr:PspC domain-containing protein [Candidatus Neomarinimicrobiota bacterium]HHZ99977.1 PspC domain-containing protein [Candidatus Neomarinimicrobiota bacterium]HIB02770.1 PspC domain-containing protein [Candidatus Neomarinimicrobiota bacterium]HIB70394.1 PspC domain-containing protein [Candidatus Neomarinimicrobiota bacterium]HIB96661.1 PspC domain-containing protein [Candidatus Neomarinimicrobiota bacterium]
MKRFYRNRDEGKSASVCAGIGDDFDVNPILIRLLFYSSVLSYGISILFYLITGIKFLNKQPQQKTIESRTSFLFTRC